MSKRHDNEIIRDIANTHARLSPENLHADGERSRSAARALSIKLNRELKALFVELGREVDECEAYDLARASR